MLLVFLVAQAADLVTFSVPIAAGSFGIEAEANPLMRFWYSLGGLAAVDGFKLGVIVVIASSVLSLLPPGRGRAMVLGLGVLLGVAGAIDNVWAWHVLTNTVP